MIAENLWKLLQPMLLRHKLLIIAMEIQAYDNRIYFVLF